MSTKYTLTLLSGLILLGCANQPTVEQIERSISSPRFSESQNYGAIPPKQYRRVTRDSLEREADLGPGAGSLWVMEGQGAYLFSQNLLRREGDILNVFLEGAAERQVETKVSVIKELLNRVERRRDLERRNLASEDGQQAAESGDMASGEDESASGQGRPELDISLVPTRIVERLQDGNFRVRGAQPFMIGQREYKVLVTGIVRPEDFNDQGVGSSKLLDAQYDVVSIRRSRNL